MARGRPSNNRIKDGVRERALELVRSAYADFGPTLAAEKLAETHDLKVSRETLRGWMIEAGLWLSRRQRRRFHQPRLRREALGELVQIDVCGRPSGRNKNLPSGRACGRVLTCVRPRDAAFHAPRARMEFADRVQLGSACSEALIDLLVFPTPSH